MKKSYENRTTNVEASCIKKIDTLRAYSDLFILNLEFQSPTKLHSSGASDSQDIRYLKPSYLLKLCIQFYLLKFDRAQLTKHISKENALFWCM